MKLRELDPHVSGDGRILVFDCPVCVPAHRIRFPWLAKGWTKTGDLDNLTVIPSINATVSGGCKFHGFIKDGEVTS